MLVDFWHALEGFREVVGVHVIVGLVDFGAGNFIIAQVLVMVLLQVQVDGFV